MSSKKSEIGEIVRFLKSNPTFYKLQGYIDSELENAREMYENNTASEFLRGRVSILKQLKHDLES